MRVEFQTRQLAIRIACRANQQYPAISSCPSISVLHVSRLGPVLLDLEFLAGGSVVVQLDALVVGTTGGGLFLEVVSRGGVLRPVLQVFLAGTVDFFFEDRFGLDGLELSLEVFDAVAVGGGIGAAARVGHIVAIILEFVALATPMGVLV